MKILADKIRVIFLFLIAGFVGFTIEAVIILLMTKYLIIHPILARVVSFPVAVLSTWFINSKFSFKQYSQPSITKFYRYLNSTILAQLSNFLSYGLIIFYFPMILPIIALIFSSLLAMNISFFLYLKYVFNKH